MRRERERHQQEMQKWRTETRKAAWEGALYPFIAGATIMGALAALLNYLKP